jgi:hypothetical protein
MEVPTTMGRSKAALVLDTKLREQLESLANSRSLPADWCVGPLKSKDYANVFTGQHT